MPRTRARGVGRVKVAGSGTGRPPWESSPNGFGMACEALGLGEQCGMWTELRDSFRRIFLHRDELDEIVDAQASAHPRHAAGRQGVVGTRDVIAHGLRGP